jgi:phosphoribosylaminoimidazolecarboxamide formyltransferase/IMP cyclohydrolase
MSTPSDLKVVTQKAAHACSRSTDLLFAWRVAHYVKSNAIVFCHDGMTMGGGCRTDEPFGLCSQSQGVEAKEAGLSLGGTVVASDAFFPSRRP